MTENLTTKIRKRVAANGAFAVVPLLIVCSLVMSSSMFYNYLNEFDGSSTSAGETQQPDAQVSTGGEGAAQPTLPEAVPIAMYTAVSSNTALGRTVNLQLAAESINGKIIEPGETFSFNAAIGDVEHDDRYQLAPVIYDNDMIIGRGGGSCQVSSALYVAALSANLKIEERHPHSAVVDYVPIGLDATVLYGYMDLKITNSSEAPITILAETEGQSVTVTLIGKPLEEGLRLEPVSMLIDYHREATPLPKYMEWDADLFNQSFYVVESYREVYYHGNKIDSLFLARDLYEVFSGSAIRMPDGNLEISK
jgi:hypothetical protein